MSLTSHIKAGKNSPIGQFFLQRFPLTTNITKEANRQLQSATTITLPNDQPLPGWVYGTIGQAIDYRVRYSFAITPSYRLIAWYGAWKLMRLSDRRKLSNKIIESGGSGVLLPNDHTTEVSEDASLSYYSFEVVDGFFESLDTILTTIQPVGRKLTWEEERLLAPYCFVLGLFEEVFRTGQSYRDWNGVLLTPAPRQSVEELLALPKDAWIDDLCTLSMLFTERCSNYLGHHAILNPVFTGSNDVGGADADLIIGGCLRELKAHIHPKLDPSWLRQLAGYLLLDYTDKYHITDIGIYMVRQGMTFTWSAKEFLGKLTGNEQTSINTLRQEFQALFGTQTKRNR